MFDVLVAGEINPDLIISGDAIPEFGQVEKLVDSVSLTVGSSSAIFACGAARLGLKVAFIGVCGDDVFGRFMLDEMAQRGVDVGNVIVKKGGSTGLSVIFNRGTDRAILTHLGLIADLEAAAIGDHLLRQARHLHVASYFLQTRLQPGLVGLFHRAHTLGLTTSLDTNYDPAGKWQGFDELLPASDILFTNETEAKSLTGTTDAMTAADILGQKVKMAAIKLGAAGALGVRGKQLARVDSIPVQVVDTVGAGDSFDAGFVYGFLNNWEMEKTLRLACVCGALSTRGAGGTAMQPSLAEAETFM